MEGESYQNAKNSEFGSPIQHLKLKLELNEFSAGLLMINERRDTRASLLSYEQDNLLGGKSYQYGKNSLPNQHLSLNWNLLKLQLL